MENVIKRISTLLWGILIFLTLYPTFAWTHGEKALEPFIRMRTIQWYDVDWSKKDLGVNDELEVTGKFHVAEDWPINVPKPDATFLNIAAPGPVFVRTERYLNGQPTMNSVALEEGGDYTFKVVLKAREPGRYHIHPFFNLHDAGVVVGPGSWVEVSGDSADFRNDVQLLSGEVIDMESYGLGNAIFWHALWILAGTGWLLWWARRPLFIQRYKMLQNGQEDELVTKTDRTLAKVILVVVVVLVLGANTYYNGKHPNAIPLQAARDQIEPLPTVVNDGDIDVRVNKIEYQIPERRMVINADVENLTETPLEVGELSIANVRFLNSSVPAADYRSSDELVVKDGLLVDDISPIAPGERRTLNIEATDAAWETEKLDGLIRDADSRMGGLLFLYGADGRRQIFSLSGAVIPKFAGTSS